MKTGCPGGEIAQPKAARASAQRARWIVSRLGVAGSLLLLTAATFQATAASLQLLSTRNPSVSQPSGGNGNSVAPVVSSDGRFVLFTSWANNLVPGDNGQLGLDVFLRDRASNTTTLISVNLNGAGGGNASSTYGGISTNGRYVVFESQASDLVPGDTNGVSDVFVRDLVTGTTKLVSVATNGLPGNGASSDAVMTPDGRYVAFISSATNLVPGDTNGIPDVFVRDLTTQTTRLVSVGASGAGQMMGTPVITPDGRYVAFFSTAVGLAPGGPSPSYGDVYLRDLLAGSSQWASANAATLAGAVLNTKFLQSYHPGLSDDGRYVAFKTAYSWSGAGAGVVLRYDSVTGLTTLITTNGIPSVAYDDDPFGPEATSDGRLIAFVQREGGSNTAYSSVHVWAAETGTDTLVSADSNGVVQTATSSRSPMLSPDGRFVAFLSNATNLVPNAVSNGFHAYLRDLQSGTTKLVDADTNGVGSTGLEGTVPSLSADGRFVGFASLDGSLVSGDGNRAYDVFLRDKVNATTELISQRDPGVVSRSGSGLSSLSQPSISADGRWVAFASFADDLVPNDTNAASDIFVRDLLNGTNLLVSAGIDGNPASDGFSVSPAISGDGRFVPFVSTATNLVAGQTNYLNNIFLHDLQAGTNVLVSVSTNGVSPGDNDSSAPVVSQDGRSVAFLSKARNLAPGFLGSGPNTFRRDILTGSTVCLLAGTAVASSPPSMSADGRFVAHFDTQSHVRVWDAQAGANIYTNNGVLASAAISPDGTRLLYRISNVAYVDDLLGKTNLLSLAGAVPTRSSPPWSADGRFFVFVTTSNAVVGDINNTNDVYLCDLSTRSLTLVTVNESHTGAVGGVPDWPTISGDGRFVVYRSFASNLVPGNTNIPNILLFDRFTGSNTVLTTQSGLSWSSWPSKPAISGDGGIVAFQSWASVLVSGDLNFLQDVFVAPTDRDADGIPDWWSLHYFGHADGQFVDHSRAQDDADGDGTTNLQEYLAGTNPTSAVSVFRLQVALADDSNGVVLSWPAMPGRSYSIQYKLNLTDPIWNDAGSVSATGNQGTFTASSTQSGGFFRVLVGN